MTQHLARAAEVPGNGPPALRPMKTRLVAGKHAREERRKRAKEHEQRHEKHSKHHGRRRKHRKAKHHHAKPHGTLPVALPVAPASPPAPSGAPVPSVGSPPISLAQARRLLWRAGFGPTPGQAEALVGQPLEQVVFGLTRPSGPATLSGPEPVNEEGKKLEPEDVWGDDHCWWLDRMLRSDQQLVEKMTFIFHDWFANSNEKVDSQRMMLEQNELFRAMVFGNFHDLFLAVTGNPAMLVFLDGIYNETGNSNENYAREMMELFSLGADRGAYTEDDVREMGRALTGWRADGPELVTPPVVYNAGLLRSIGRPIDTTAWAWLSANAGQQLFYPPNVSGWDFSSWLDTSTVKARWEIASSVTEKTYPNPWPQKGEPEYSKTESPSAALSSALAYWANPLLSAESEQCIANFAQTCLQEPLADWEESSYRALRQNALRMLIATSPDLQVS